MPTARATTRATATATATTTATTTTGGEPHQGDFVFTSADGDARLVVDEISYGFVKGATIDYVEEMIKSSFEVVKNPQADASCGCGASFNAKDALFS
jgi:iron-sulfur cluster assembly accessory protein